MAGSFGADCRKCVFGRRYKILFLVNNKIAAALACFGISFITQNGIGVFNGNNAYIAFVSQQAFAGQFAAKRIDAVDYVISQLMIKLYICTLIVLSVNGIFHLII